MKQPYDCMSTKRVLPMSIGATNTQSLMWPANFNQMFHKKWLPILGIFGQVNHLVYSRKINLVILGPPPPPKWKFISKKLHDWLLDSFAINLYIYQGHLAWSFADKLLLKSPLSIIIAKMYSIKCHTGTFLVVFCTLMSTSTLAHPWYIFGHKGAFFHGLLH